MKSKIILIISILLGLMMVNSGLNKFLHYMPFPEMSGPATELIGVFVASGWVFALVGIAELVGGILLAIPKTRALGAIVLFPVMCGILLFHIFQDPATVIMPIIFFIINVGIILFHKDQYMSMIK